MDNNQIYESNEWDSCLSESDSLSNVEVRSYNKFVKSKYNLLNIAPIEPEPVRTYYLGVFKRLKNVGMLNLELMEMERSPSGSKVEDYFPMTVEALNHRANWRCLSTEEALKADYIDFSWTNMAFIARKSRVHSRFLLDSLDNFLSNKRVFYNTFKKYDFCPKFVSFNQNQSPEIWLEKINSFINQNNYQHSDEDGNGDGEIILKPDKGAVSKGVKVINLKTNPNCLEEILNHLNQFPFQEWTLSEVVHPKLYHGYVTSLRLYLLITKKNDQQVSAYLYDHYMIYRADQPYQGDSTDQKTFLTNYMDKKNDPDAEEKFIKNRYIPHQDWLNNFSKSAQEKLHHKIHEALSIIIERTRDCLLGFNDQRMSQRKSNFNEPKDWLSYHVYGVDALVREDGSFKIIEVNGAPSMNVKTRYYGLQANRVDSFDLFEDLLTKIIDPIFVDMSGNQYKKSGEMQHQFKLIYQSNRQTLSLKQPLYYIGYSITQKYPFILEALNRRKYLRRSRTMYDQVDLFWGLRERYIVPESNMNYYDEIINYLTSKRMRNARIINKVQGITYYLASKDRMYSEIVKKYGKKIAYRFLPQTFHVYYQNYHKTHRRLYHKITKYYRIDKWIVKPVHGSRGLGIAVFDTNDFNSRWELAHAMTAHIQIGSNLGYSFKNETVQTKTAFDGIKLGGEYFYQNRRFHYWAICRYLDHPHLLIPPRFYQDKELGTVFNKLSKRRRRYRFGHKYNIRFYVLLVLGELPTFKDIRQNEYSHIEAYIFKDFMTYFTMLPYHDRGKREFDLECLNHLSEKIISEMRHLTNFEIINKVHDENQRTKNNSKDLNFENIDREKYKASLTGLYSEIVSSRKFKHVRKQIYPMVKYSLNSVKYHLRPLNRYSENGYLGCFNLLAYDTLLDSRGHLWLIEINRGPDIVGLQKTMGHETCTDIFDEIFQLTLDPHFVENNDNSNNNNADDDGSKELKYFEKLDLSYRGIHL